MERLFERGIDPDSVESALPRSGAGTVWPSRDDVLEYGARADAAIVDALQHADFDMSGATHRAMRGGEAIFTALEHEAMHQETLLYMAPPGARAEDAAGAAALRARTVPPPAVTIPAGVATLGAARGDILFGWDNEFGAQRVTVPAFEIDVHSVSNADFLRFVDDDGGYRTRALWSDAGWAWREAEAVASRSGGTRAGSGAGAVFEHIPLPEAWPVRELRGGRGVCTLARTAPRDRGGVPPRRLRHAGRGRASAALGRRGRRREPR